MATPRLLRPALPTLSRRAHPVSQSRPFLSALIGSQPSPQVLSATRILPFPAYPIFSIIADIESYPHFLPLCTSATVTSLSNPDAQYARRWPQEATLTVGLPNQNITESFTSRVTCVPPHKTAPGRAGVGVVEALSGTDIGGLSPAGLGYAPDEAAHHTHAQSTSSNAADAGAAPLAMLRTRWQVREWPYKGPPADGAAPQEGRVEPDSPRAVEHTQVSLRIEFRFKSPVYDALSRAVSGGIAERMVEAFERRVRRLLDGEGESVGRREG